MRLSIKPKMKKKTINGLHCRIYGEGEQTLLLIHGACVDADFFHDTAELLSKYYTVITYDRRGYGRNDDCENHSLQAQAEDIHRIVEEAGGHVSIIAHSAGTIPAMKYAIAYPETIEKCILYEPIASRIVKDDTYYIETLEKTEEKIRNRKYMGAVSLFMTLMGNKDRRAREARDEELRHVSKNCRNFILNEFHEMYFELTEAQKITVPVWIGLGEQSMHTAREEMAMYLKEQMQCPLLYFPGGHNCPFDLPKEFSYLVKGILEES